MTSRSRSLSDPASPRAAEPKRMIRSGAATRTMRRTISASEAPARLAVGWSCIGASSLPGPMGISASLDALIDLLLPPGPLPLAQHELLHLAGRGLRQVAELDRFGDLESRQAAPAELAQLVFAHLLAWFQGDERLGHLAPVG